MTWRWRFEDESGGEVDVPDLEGQEFHAQGDAESWLGEAWRDLLDGGVSAVTLLEEEREVYGPMSLHSA